MNSAPTTPAPAHQAPQSFSWGRLIVQMHLTGLPAMIACHCEPVHYNAETPFLRLEIPDVMQGFAKTPAMAQFKVALKDFFGENLELELVNGPALKSPAALSAAKKIGIMVQAQTAIMNDELVQKMIKEFGARVFIESVLPVAPAPVAVKKPG